MSFYVLLIVSIAIGSPSWAVSPDQVIDAANMICKETTIPALSGSCDPYGKDISDCVNSVKCVSIFMRTPNVQNDKNNHNVSTTYYPGPVNKYPKQCPEDQMLAYAQPRCVATKDAADCTVDIDCVWTTSVWTNYDEKPPSAVIKDIGFDYPTGEIAGLNCKIDEMPTYQQGLCRFSNDVLNCKYGFTCGKGFGKDGGQVFGVNDTIVHEAKPNRTCEEGFHLQKFNGCDGRPRDPIDCKPGWFCVKSI